MKFGFVAKHRGAWPVEVLCEALGVSRSGFYAWRTRPQSRRTRTDARILVTIRTTFALTDGTYGARRMLGDVRDAGHVCGRQRVARLMRSAALWARPRRRARPQDDGVRAVHAIAPNILDRQFTATAPDQKWVADFTYLWTTEGWLFVAAVLDLFSRRVVGWSMHATMTTQLVTDALLMALWRRGATDALLPSLRPGQPVHQRRVSPAARRPGRHVQHESRGQCLGSRRDGKLLLDPKNGTDPPSALRQPERGPRRRVRLHRAVLQPHPTAFDAGQHQPGRLRAGSGSSLIHRPRNPAQLTQ